MRTAVPSHGVPGCGAPALLSLLPAVSSRRCAALCSVTGLRWDALRCCRAAARAEVALGGSSASCPRGGAPSGCTAPPARTPVDVLWCFRAVGAADRTCGAHCLLTAPAVLRRHPGLRCHPELRCHPGLRFLPLPESPAPCAVRQEAALRERRAERWDRCS